jgi:hypothetical protein
MVLFYYFSLADGIRHKASLKVKDLLYIIVIKCLSVVF